jgi:molybdate transport system ATP-binding protein
MTLFVDAEKAFGAFRLKARFESHGRITALFGRSGSGKTTLVNLIAGLTRPDRGVIRLDDTVLFDSAAGIDVPAHRRALGYVFQEGRLFPHLSVRANLLYGRTFGGRRSDAASLDEIAALLDIAPLLARRPADLSGGEKQRVAIGRALLAEPSLLLMDEPLAALDAARKAEIVPYIERLASETRLPMVYVSHAVEEIATLADTLVLLADGVTIASGSVNEVFGRLDLRRYTGHFEASTVVSARVAASDAAAGVTVLEHPAGRLSVPWRNAPAGTTVRLRVRARDIALAVGEPGRLSIRNRLAATVAEIGAAERGAAEVKLNAGGDPLIARITTGALKDLDLRVGQPVVALIKSTAFDRLDEE